MDVIKVTIIQVRPIGIDDWQTDVRFVASFLLSLLPSLDMTYTTYITDMTHMTDMTYVPSNGVIPAIIS